MMNAPQVSICIPTYNAGEFFEPCLQSALAQTYPNLEILISDDGSTDETLNIAQRYSKQHSHIRVIENPQKGMVHNWNNCIQQAKGSWIKFLFQDDLLMPECVQVMLKLCEQHQVVVGLCSRDFIIHDDVPKIVRYQFKYQLVRPERVFGNITFITPEELSKGVAEHLQQNVLGEPSCYFFHRSILESTGMFNPEYKQVMDYEFFLRLSLKKGLAFSPQVLALFRVHGKSESSANKQTDKDVQIRHVAATIGDYILLFYNFIHHPEFSLIKQAVGEDELVMVINHIYQSGCKHKGKTVFNKAIAPLRTKYKEIGALRYSLFKYAYYRKLYKSWERKLRYG